MIENKASPIIDVGDLVSGGTPSSHVWAKAGRVIKVATKSVVEAVNNDHNRYNMRLACNRMPESLVRVPARALVVNV